MMRVLFLCCLTMCLTWANSSMQAQRPLGFGIQAGAMFGGTIPAERDRDSSSGSLAVGPMGGAFLNYAFSEKWSLQVDVSYAMKGATYQQLYRNDTLMPLQIIPGVVDTVPTYYFANVSGKMRLHYLDIPLKLNYKLGKRMQVFAGPMISIALAGRDTGTVDIQIGDGLLFPDTSTIYDNFPDINRVDWGLTLGGRYEIIDGLSAFVMAQRSFRSLYRKGFMSSQGLPEIPLFHTQFTVGLSWQPSRKSRK